MYKTETNKLMNIQKNLRRGDLVKNIIEEINLLANKYNGKEIKLMEVCGTHTLAIFRTGIRSLLPEKIKLISGPGCPVCVTSDYDIDRALNLAVRKDIIFATYGDMIKVPGTNANLAEIRAGGSQVKIIHSALDALKLAIDNPEQQVVFMGIGFETTAPATAVTVQQAREKGVDNFSVLSSHKLVVPTMEALLEDEQTEIGGFICPGHVSTIIGANAYQPIAEKYEIPCVVAGFEPLDILDSIYRLIKQIVEDKTQVENQYRRAVRKKGNEKALERMYSVFEPAAENWRGLGKVGNSGLKFKEEWSYFSAEKRYKIDVEEPVGERCPCGEILKGIKTPKECPLFGEKCKPEHPVGPCMVSTEGSCSVYYKYAR